MGKDEILKRMLIDAKKIFAKNDTVFWLDCGTLLGFVREGGFLKWENDIDLGVFEQKTDLRFRRKLMIDFREAGYETLMLDASINFRSKQNREICLDVNFYKKENDFAVKALHIQKNILGNFLRKLTWSFYDIKQLRIGKFTIPALIRNLLILPISVLFSMLPVGFQESILSKMSSILWYESFFIDKKWIVPIFFFENLSTMVIFNQVFNIPNDSSGYLEYRYGNTWQNPDENWDTEAQDKSLTGNR